MRGNKLLNGDGQQNEQPPLSDTKNTTTPGIGNLDPGLEQEIYEEKKV